MQRVITLSCLLSLVIQPAEAQVKKESVSQLIPSMLHAAPQSVSDQTSAYSQKRIQDLAQTKDPRTHYQRGMYFKQKGNLNSALIEFLKATQENPRLVKAYYEQALIFHQRGYLKLAESSLEQALAVDSSFQQARVLLATVRLGQGNITGAVSELSRSLGLENNSAASKKTTTPDKQPASTNVPSPLDKPAAPPSLLQALHNILPEPQVLRTQGRSIRKQATAPIQQKGAGNNVPAAIKAHPAQTPPAQTANLDDILKGIPGIDPNVPLTPSGQSNSATQNPHKSSNWQAANETDISASAKKGGFHFHLPWFSLNGAPKSDATGMLANTSIATANAKAEQKRRNRRHKNELSKSDEEEASRKQKVDKLDKRAAKLKKKAEKLRRKAAGKLGLISGNNKSSVNTNQITPRGTNTDLPANSGSSREKDQSAIERKNEQRNDRAWNSGLKTKLFAFFQPRAPRMTPEANNDSSTASNTKSTKESKQDESPDRLAALLISSKTGTSSASPQTIDSQSTDGFTRTVTITTQRPPAARQKRNTNFAQFPTQAAIQSSQQPNGSQTINIQSSSQITPPVALRQSTLARSPTISSQPPIQIKNSLPAAGNPAPRPNQAPAPQRQSASSRPPAISSQSTTQVAASLPLPANSTQRPSPASTPQQAGLAQHSLPPAIKFTGKPFQPPILPSTQMRWLGLPQSSQQRAHSASSPHPYSAKQTPSGSQLSPSTKSTTQPGEDNWTKRLRYLSEHGTDTLNPGEAFMFSEETGEAVLFLPKGESIRRKVAQSQDPDDVIRSRRPDILGPQRLEYNLSLLGKLLPRQPEQQAAQASPQTNDPLGNLNISDMLQNSNRFWDWLRQSINLNSASKP